jgi:hypothetical protein
VLDRIAEDSCQSGRAADFGNTHGRASTAAQ